MRDPKKLGCFGFVITHNSDSPTCQDCELETACGKTAAARSERLLKLMGDSLTPKLRKSITAHHRAQGTANPATPPAPASHAALKPKKRTTPKPKNEPPQMSKKAKQLFGSLKRKDLDIVAAVLEEKQIMSESDPFAFVRLALDLLVAGNLTREALKDSLESNLEWAEGTANSHVGIVFNLFNYIGEAGEAA